VLINCVGIIALGCVLALTGRWG